MQNRLNKILRRRDEFIERREKRQKRTEWLKQRQESKQHENSDEEKLAHVEVEEIQNNIAVIVREKAIQWLVIAFKVVLFLLTILLPMLGSLLYKGTKWMLATWAHLSMEELVAQLKTPMKGTNSDLIWDFVRTCVPAAVSALLFIIALLVLIRHLKIKQWIVQIGAIATSCVLIFSSLHSVWVELDVGEYLENQDTISMFLQENYIDASLPTLTFPEEKRNLIYIFMESMESTYASEEVGGGMEENYIPEMVELSNENINFSSSDGFGGISPVDGATWTMGALVAQTSGLPLKINLRSEKVEGDVEILPGATVLGDILEEQGYNQVFLIGSDGEFAGRKQYFESHGEYEVKDYVYALEHGWIPSDYWEWWGYEDSKLYEFAKQELTELAGKGEPFNLTMLTVDTHFEDGYICPLCGEEHGENQYGNVMSCASRQVVDFVNWVKEQPYYENTTIVIVGDHLTMDSDFCNTVSRSYQRGVYNTIINAPIEPVYEKNRQVVTMDMFPTTLAALGVEIEGNRLGLGTNLFSELPTLAEQFGIEKLNQEIRKRSIFYEQIAGKDNIDDSIME